MRKFVIKVNNQPYEVEVEEVKTAVSSKSAAISPVSSGSAHTPEKHVPTTIHGPGTVVSPMPGNILKIQVKPGDTVKKGQVLLVLEAMKMENEIQSPTDAKVGAVNVAVGQCVGAGDVLVALI